MHNTIHTFVSAHSYIILSTNAHNSFVAAINNCKPMKERSVRTLIFVFLDLSIIFRTWINSIHYNDVIMSAMACQITSLTIVYSTVYSNADQRKHQIVPHKHQVSRKIFSLILIRFLSVALLGTYENHVLKLHRWYLWSVASKISFWEGDFTGNTKINIICCHELKITQKCPNFAWNISIS